LKLRSIALSLLISLTDKTVFHLPNPRNSNYLSIDRTYILKTGRAAMSGSAAELRENDQVKAGDHSPP
jgi:ABC-type branched-subunit amino acid transport system ATPase component